MRREPAKQAQPAAASALDPVEITLILLGLGALLLFSPALAFHSRTPAGAWHWNIRCTVACLAWWGFLLSCAGGFILSRANSPAVRAMEKAQRPWAPEVPQPAEPDLRLMWVTEFLEP